MSLPWDPALYRRHDDHRARPFLDLVGRIGASDPREAVDLGCGPGHLTGVLAQRWPGARIRACDGSPEMVAAARELGVDAELADVRDFAPDAGTDVVVANAVLHWVPEHRDLLARWAGALPAGGWLAVQVPGNERSPSHVVARDLLASPAWADLVPAGLPAYGVGTPDEYARLLSAARPGGSSTAGRRPTCTRSPATTRWATGSRAAPCARRATCSTTPGGNACARSSHPACATPTHPTTPA